MFKPGDKVVCKEPCGIFLELGRTYTVTKTNLTQCGSVSVLFVYLEGVEGGWSSRRFDLVESKTSSEPRSTQESIEFLFENFKEYFGAKFKKFIKKEELADVLLDNFKEFLKEKNRRYGDSALNPLNIFSKEPADNELCNRLDDKLSRIKVSKELRKNDVADVFGYIALLLISKGWTSFEDLLD